MRVLGIVRVIAIVFAGLMAGVYLADRASALARATLSASSFVEYQQTVHTTYVKMMPVLVFGAMLGCLGWVFMQRRQWRGAEFWLIAASCVGIGFVIVVTRAVNVPLNNQLMTWNAAAPPSNLRELWASWERVDAIRTIVALGVFVLEAVALTLNASRKHVSIS